MTTPPGSSSVPVPHRRRPYIRDDGAVWRPRFENCPSLTPTWLLLLNCDRGTHVRSTLSASSKGPRPYLNIGATLRLTGSRIRQTPRLADTPLQVPLRHTTAIETSAAQNDAGVFEFSFRDERYMPFEGAGAASDWQLELPATFRAFDFRTISDVILRISYTAEHSDDLRTDVQRVNTTAEGSLISWLKTQGLPLSFSLRHDFPDAWRMLVTSPAGTVIGVELGQRRLPGVRAGWLRGQAATPVRLTFAPGNSGTVFALVTEGAGTPLVPNTSFTSWLGAATPPNPAPNPLTFTVGGSGLYSATMTGSATLDAATSGTIRLRVNAAGNLAPAALAGDAAPLALIDEDKLRDIMIMATVRIA